MIKARSLFRLAWGVAIAFTAVLALLFVFALIINSGFDDVVIHLFGGFFFFLRENLAKLSADSTTWVPGLVAFGLALVIAHRFLHQHSVRRNRSWNLVSTACLGLFLPILFVVAYIVPGALLQVKSLAGDPWFERSSSLPAVVSLSLRNIAQACHYFASTHPDGRFPDSLGSLDEELIPKENLLLPSTNTSVPLEPPIYLGARFSFDSPPDQALLISPPFRKNKTDIRILVTRGGETREIPANDADTWIDKVFKEMKPARLK